MHESFALPYRTFDKLRSVHRPEVVENKRLDDMLSIVAEMQAGREQQRSKSGPRRTGQTNHMFGIRAGSTANTTMESASLRREAAISTQMSN